MTTMFTPVKVNRASEDVIEQIKEAIFSGKLSPGDRLPPERELVREFGLSRVTIREAIRTLEAAGIVRVKTGANGGAFIADVNSQIVTDSLTTLLKLHKATVQELSEARKVVETAIVEMAADRADDDDLAAMQQTIEMTRQAIANNVSCTAANLEFHVALAKAAKNRVLLSAVNSFRGPLNEAFDRLGAHPEMPSLALEDHVRILDAIRRHDASLSRHLMEAHLQHLEERLQDLLDAERTEVVGNGSARDHNP